MILGIDNDSIKKRLIDLINSKKGCTREQVAERCNIGKSTVDGHFNGNKKAQNIDIETLYKYAQYFDVSLDYLITGKQEIKGTLSKSFEECWASEKADKILDSLRVLLEAYGTRDVTIEDRSNGEYEICCTTFDFYDWMVMKYIDKAKPVIENKELFLEHGLYEAAWENLKNKLWANQFVVFDTRERRLKAYSKPKETEEDDLPF